MFVCRDKAKKCASAFSLSNARYDHMSWYPLGRPVGSTIYPGMQLTAVALCASKFLDELHVRPGFH